MARFIMGKIAQQIKKMYSKNRSQRPGFTELATSNSMPEVLHRRCQNAAGETWLSLKATSLPDVTI